ncbi:thialysine N-epsilon-acetyltransferase-like [Clytia hemisphaerica]|uniref:N-acetyltransferase domain-containing protein n=1 Tax=Clytia hemisphaerica TaxID=252671 RepID=A0A7M5XKC7_9CNID
MESFVMRDAVSNDCDDIMKLIVNLAVFENEPESRVKITKEELIRDGFSEKKWFRCLIGEVISTGESGQEITTMIGYALFFPTYSTWNGRTIKIEDLYIEPAFRGKGYGTQMLKRVNEIALSEGCSRVHWNVLDWNKNAIEFYKRLGAEYSEEWRVCTLHHPEMIGLSKK